MKKKVINIKYYLDLKLCEVLIHKSLLVNFFKVK